MHIGITGTRNGLTEAQFDRLEVVLKHDSSITHIHAGDCEGVDIQVIQVCEDLRPDVKRIVHPPLNGTFRAFGKYDETRPAKDYLKRNKDIVDECSRLWGFPKERKEVLRSGT